MPDPDNGGQFLSDRPHVFARGFETGEFRA